MTRDALLDSLSSLLTALAAGAMWGLYGLGGPLSHDGGIYAYGGVQLARGVMPYVSIFDHKGPLATMIAGLGAALGPDPLTGIRLVYLLLGMVLVFCTAQLGQALSDPTGAEPDAPLQRRLRGVFAGLFLAGCVGLGRNAIAGPRPKVAMLACAVGALWLSVRGLRRRQGRALWLCAGVLGGLTGLVWQPTAVVGLLVLGAALAPQAEDAASPPDRLRRAGAVIAGGLLPVLLTIGWFASRGAADALLEGALLFNLGTIERPPGQALAGRLQLILNSVRAGYPGMFLPFALGGAAGLLAWLQRQRRLSGLAARWADPWTPLAGFALFGLGWSLLDYQWYPDFYLLLVPLCLAAGGALAVALQQGLRGLPARGRLLGLLAVAGLLWLDGALHHRTWSWEERNEGSRLADQRALLEEAGLDAMGDELLVLGAPEVLTLLGRSHPDRFVFIANGVDNLIEQSWPGGVAGWWAERSQARTILVGRIDGRRLGPVEQALEREYEARPLGRWTLYQRR